MAVENLSKCSVKELLTYTSEKTISSLKVMIVSMTTDEHPQMGVLADQTGAIHFTNYNRQTKAVKTGNTITVQTAIYRDRGLVLTPKTKVYRNCDMDIPEIVQQEALTKKDGPRFPEVNIKAILESPPGRYSSTAGFIISVDREKPVQLRDGGTAQVKEVTLRDDSGETIVALWNESAKVECPPGSKMVIRDAKIRFNPYRKFNTVTVSRPSQIIISYNEPEEKEITIEGFTNDNDADDITLMTDSVTMKCHPSVLADCLGLAIWDEDCVVSLLPASITVKFRGERILGLANEK